MYKIIIFLKSLRIDVILMRTKKEKVKNIKQTKKLLRYKIC